MASVFITRIVVNLICTHLISIILLQLHICFVAADYTICPILRLDVISLMVDCMLHFKSGLWITIKCTHLAPIPYYMHVLWKFAWNTTHKFYEIRNLLKVTLHLILKLDKFDKVKLLLLISFLKRLSFLHFNFHFQCSSVWICWYNWYK